MLLKKTLKYAHFPSVKSFILRPLFFQFLEQKFSGAKKERDEVCDAGT